MKKIKPILLTIVGLAFCRALLLPPDSLGATVSEEGNNAMGFGEMFTPQQDFSFDSVQLMVTGYTDQYPGLPQNSTLELSLSVDAAHSWPGYPYMEPAGSFASGTATINAASGTDYAFNLSASLQANTPYWVSLFLVGPDGSIGISANWDQASFGCASDPDILVNGYESGVGSISPPFQSGMPVPVTVVPEAPALPCYTLGWILSLLARETFAGKFQQAVRAAWRGIQ